MGWLQRFKRWGRETVIFVIILFFLSLLLNWFRAPKLEDRTLPILTGKTLQGESVQEILHAKGPVMIHFWGSWCPVCRQEAGNIQRVAQRYPVLTIAVNSGSPEEIGTWMKAHGVDYPVFVDPYGELASRFKVEVYPTTFIYDADKTLKFVESGYTTTAGLLARMKLAE